MCQEIDRICNTNAVTYPVIDKTARLNQALDRFFALALLGDGDWEFDDSNQTDLPIGTTNINSGQYDYTFASELLMISKVMVANTNGDFNELFPIDQSEGMSRNLYIQPTNNTGTPNRYDVLANSLLLDPIPNYTANGALKVIFKRNATRFVVGDTTKEPGIPSLYHEFLARYASAPYLLANRLANAGAVGQQIQTDEDSIQDFLAHRSKHRKTRITPVYRSSR